MKKLVFTLAIAVFFVTFSNAQSTDEKAAEAKQSVELTSVSKEKVACAPGCTKECCADKKECTDKKEKAACADKKSTSKKASLRPSSCADKKTSCKDKKTSCKDKKATKSNQKASLK